MSDNEFQNLGRRLLACEAFRWLPGMAVWDLHCAERQRVLAVDEKNWAALSALGAEPTWTSPDFIEDNGWLPDLRDAATKGCVLELVRELGEDPTYACCRDGDGERDWWTVSDSLCCWFGKGETEAEALVSAMYRDGDRA